MEHSEFVIGEVFWCSDRQWRCTDIGTRTILAILFDSVRVSGSTPDLCRTLTGAEAEREGWFRGPPYAVKESVFDEDFMPACTREL